MRTLTTGLLLTLSVAAAYAQDLSPRAYVVSPTGSHAIIFSTGFNRGDVLVDPTVPLEDGKGTFQVPVLGYYQSLNFLGRSANVTVLMPYIHGSFEGNIGGTFMHVTRSGLADARVRFSVNLYGGKAMGLGEDMNWKEKRLIGASLTVTMPAGQYDPARLVNPGTNRWGIKPEIGMTRRWGKWVGDLYGGAWFFTGNDQFFPGKSVRTQKPVGSVEGHWGYYFAPRLWLSFDMNFWAGSRSTVDGVEKQDKQKNSRLGGTVSLPVRRSQSLKFSYSQGAYVTIGGAYRTITAAWQYSWIRLPK